MLNRVTLHNQIVVYQSRLFNSLGVTHAFSTRVGGVSPPPFQTLNLGNPQGTSQDSKENLRANMERILAGLGMSDVAVATVRQVHGGKVASRRMQQQSSESSDRNLSYGLESQTQADAMVSDVTSVVLAIRIADCVPILLATDDGRIVAAIHAGWRGVLAEVVPHTITEINIMGVASARIIAAIGPAIGVEHFEVGPEVAEQFHTAGLGGMVKTIGYVKPHLDLVGAIKQQLRQCGITRIEGGELCTFANAGDFFSHRRDHGITGRMAAIIRPVCPPAG